MDKNRGELSPSLSYEIVRQWCIGHRARHRSIPIGARTVNAMASFTGKGMANGVGAPWHRNAGFVPTGNRMFQSLPLNEDCHYHKVMLTSQRSTSHNESRPINVQHSVETQNIWFLSDEKNKLNNSLNTVQRFSDVFSGAEGDVMPTSASIKEGLRLNSVAHVESLTSTVVMPRITKINS
nr:hypothetical transcript [Hymenolepis microstoma]